MNSRRLSATLAVLLLLELSLAVLPHVHHHEAVRVGELHLGHDHDGRCLVAPIELLPPGHCLACASHVPSAANPAARPLLAGLNTLDSVPAEVREPRGDTPPAVRRSRAPPALEA